MSRYGQHVDVLLGSDPKAAVAAPKAPLHLIPPVAAKAMAEALDDGRKKYGFFNWRHTNVNATVYIAAAKRHLDAWMDGEDLSADAGVHHFGHAMAGLAILLDAMAHGTLIDDRPPRLGLAKEEKNAGTTNVLCYKENGDIEFL